MGKGGLHLLLGPDRGRQWARVQAVAQALQVNTLDRHTLDAAVVDAAEFLAIARQQPALSPLRLLVIDSAHRLSSAAARALLEHAHLLAQTACVLLLADREFAEGHPFASPSDRLTVERFGAAAHALKPFALLEALGTRDAAHATQVLWEQVDAGKDPMELLGMVAWQLTRWMAAKRLRQAEVPSDHAARLLGVKPWHWERLGREVAPWSIEGLRRLLTRCWQLDREVKRGHTPVALAVERLVYEICWVPTTAGVTTKRAAGGPAAA